MAELLDYDDDPADTAATLWLATRLGQRTQELAVTCPESALRRAFRCGFLAGKNAAMNQLPKASGVSVMPHTGVMYRYICS